MSLPTVFARELGASDKPVRAVRFNVNGNYCLTCGSDKLLRLWNPFTGIELKNYSGHGYEVLDATASNDSARIVSCSADKTVVLWDVSTGQIVRKFRGHISVSIELHGFSNCILIFQTLEYMSLAALWVNLL